MSNEESKISMFRNRISKVYRHLGRQARRMNVSCYRIYDHDIPEFPFCIEIYADKLYIAEYERRFGLSEDAHERWQKQCLEIITELIPVKKENIFLKQRRRIKDRQNQYQKLKDLKKEFEVEENGLKFIVNLSDYLDTGLFLDHRLTRQMVKEKAKNKSVLNLFAYTGSFSVYAADGGALNVTTVDLSKTYLQWAEKNMQLNGFTDPLKYIYVQADVIQYLSSLKENLYDIIIMDPPTFSNSKRMEGVLDIQKDHPFLINQSVRVFKSKGILFFSTNYSQFHLEKEKINTSSISDITKQTTPFDFAGKLNRWCFRILKKNE